MTDDHKMVMDANDSPRAPPIVAIAADHRAGRFRLPVVLTVYVELKAQ
jgi:hypothetical protein